MPVITLGQINSAISDTLGAVAAIRNVQDFDAISEGIINTPTLQTYWDGLQVDVTTNTERTTFGGKVRQYDLIFFCDLYVQRHAHSKKMLKEMYPLIDAITAVFEAQEEQPFFGLAGIKAFSYEAQRALFDYGMLDSKPLQYDGVRWTLTVRVF